MIAILRLDASGTVVAANAAAEERLGSCVGRRCCDVVVARSSDRNLICGTECAANIAAGGCPQELRGVRVRGRRVRMICAAADDNPMVLIIEDGVDDADGVVLSPRESAILALVAAGQNDQQMAGVLGVQPSTVKTHLRRARDKLGASTRAEAVALAIRSGLIP